MKRVNERATWVLAMLLLLVAGPGLGQRLPTLPPLNDPPTGRSIPGKIVWADLFSADVVASQRFYAALLGWTWRTYGAGDEAYHVAYAGDQPVAGLVFREVQKGEGAQAGWIGYASSPDPGAVAERVMNAGGRILLAPRDIPYRGQHAIFVDNQGALFGVLRSGTGDPPDYRAEIGEWIWSNLFTTDPERAAAFYTETLGYEALAFESTERPDDIVLVASGHARAGIGQTRLEADSGGRPAWVGFIRVEDVDQIAARVEELGGTLLVTQDLETRPGRMAIIADPAGATLGLLAMQFDDGTGAAR